MKKIIPSLILILFSISLFAQTLDSELSQKKMRNDLKIFKNIREKANSGLYKHRTKNEIDSIYIWANNQIQKSKTFGDFYNIICQLSDFEGSTHNGIELPSKIWNNLKLEKEGYFPFPIKLIQDKWILNFGTESIPLGSEIVSINGEKTTKIVQKLYKYYETDGFNTTGKRIGIDRHFSRYYRQTYGLQKSFEVVYNSVSNSEIKVNLASVSLVDYYKNSNKRYSESFDKLDYSSSDLKDKYNYKILNSETGVLTINSFEIGENAESNEHLKFVKFLDSTFATIKSKKVKNLILDIRHNGGGTDPNELVVYEYLTARNFSENKSAWISFKKIPYLKYIETKVPFFLRFLGVIKYNRQLQQEFPKEIDGKFYQDETSQDHEIRVPNKNTFNGNVYLLISSRVASAGSNFGALVASNKNATIVGEETQGGYYGHNGHTPITYILPNSKIRTTFSVVNIEQDVILKESQPLHRGIMPDYNSTQSHSDYINNADTQMNFVLQLIDKNR